MLMNKDILFLDVLLIGMGRIVLFEQIMRRSYVLYHFQEMRKLSTFLSYIYMAQKIVIKKIK